VFEVSYKFLIIIIIIALGYVAKRFNVLQKSDGDALSRLAFNFTLPAVIITVFSDVSFEKSYIVFPLLGVIIGIIMFGASLLVYKRYTNKVKGILTMPLLGINIGLFAVPLVQVIWGEEATKYLLMMDFGNAFVIFILCYMVGAVYAQDKKDVNIKNIGSKALRSIPLLIYILTIALKILGIYYPKFIIDFALIVSKANTPVSMITLGLFLSFSFNMFQLKQLMRFWMTKYGIGLALGLAVYFFAPLENIQKLVILLAFILPSSFSVIAYSVELKYDTKFVGVLVNSSIIISIIFMWVIALVTR